MRLLLSFLCAAVTAFAQTQPSPSFEVASIRANPSGGLAMRVRASGQTWRATNMPLRNLIATAYRLPAARVLGGPSWAGAAALDMRMVGGDRFDISATLPAGSREEQTPEMLRRLLADRFHLAAHVEAREAPMYALTVVRSDGRLGPQLRPAPVNCQSAPEDHTHCQLEIGGSILGRGQQMSDLARVLSLFAGRAVRDDTGLTGGYDFDLQTPELNTSPDGARSADPSTELFIALRDQLGLRLNATQGNLDFVIIDGVDHPTAN
jgi:uncharacterized protein (TIGR03435 family)